MIGFEELTSIATELHESESRPEQEIRDAGIDPDAVLDCGAVAVGRVMELLVSGGAQPRTALVALYGAGFTMGLATAKKLAEGE